MALPDPPPLGASALPAGAYEGQVIAVTGGGTGLGKGMALEFARLGAKIAVLSRKPEHLAAGIAAIEAIGGKAAGIACDVRDPEAIARAFDEIEQRLGPVDVLINNAAGNFPAAAEEMTPNGFRTVVDIVLNGTYNCSREFALRRMAAAQPGAILNIGATYSWTGGPGTAHSAAAKAGVTNLTQSLAVEWAPDGIRVNCLAPGRFPHDDLPEHMTSHRVGESADRTIPAQRVGVIRELGWAATYLCSPYAVYISGHTLVIDGANWLRRSLVMPEFVPIREQFGKAARERGSAAQAVASVRGDDP
ncbi:MAG: SDR family oxidoreductase [Novosphingobium sp.]|nr:SDR family oxidoreductase [Novosphingobium sp.]